MNGTQFKSLFRACRAGAATTLAHRAAEGLADAVGARAAGRADPGLPRCGSANPGLHAAAPLELVAVGVAGEYAGFWFGKTTMPGLNRVPFMHGILFPRPLDPWHGRKLSWE